MRLGRIAAGLLAAGAVALASPGTAGAQVSTPFDPDAFPFVFDLDGGLTQQLTVGGDTYVVGDFGGVLTRAPSGTLLVGRDGQGAIDRDAVPPVTGDVLTVVPDGAGGLILGGNFTAVGTTARSGLARLRPTGALDPSWNPAPDGTVTKLVRSGTRIVALGAFTRIGGKDRAGLAVLDAASAAPTAFVSGLDGDVTDVAVAGDRVYALRGRDCGEGPALDALDLDSGAREDWSITGADGICPALVATDGATVLVDVPTSVTPRIAGIDATTGALRWEEDQPTDDYEAQASILTAADGRGFVGQTGGIYGGTVLSGIDLDTGEPLWQQAVDTNVVAMDIDGPTLYVAAQGSAPTPDRESFAPPAPHGFAAAYDVSSGAKTAWEPGVGRPGPRVIGRLGTGVFVGGDFIAAGVVSDIADAVRVRADGTIDPSFAPGRILGSNWGPDVYDKNVRVLALEGRKLWVGGSFEQVGTAKATDGLAVIDTVSGAVSSSGLTPRPFGIDGIRFAPDRIILDGFPCPCDSPGQTHAEFARDGTPLPDGPAFRADLRGALDVLDLTTAAGRAGALTLPEAGRLRIRVTVGDTVVARASLVATAAGDVAFRVRVNDVGRFILSVYPAYAFAGRATFTPASGGPAVSVEAPVVADGEDS